MAELTVKPISDAELPQVKRWMFQHHYIGRWPAGVRYKLGIYNDNQLIGTLLYGAPLRAQSGSELFQQDGKPLIQNNQVVELLRAFTTDDAKKSIPNLGSTVIARGNEWVRTNGKSKDGKPIKAILSYADPEAGHSGGVYKATNAAYLGTQRPSRVLVVTDPKSGVSAEIHPMTLKRYGKNLQNHPAVKGKKFEWKPVAGKHKYLYPVGKDQKERDALMAHLTVPLYSYPSPGKESEVIPNPAKDRVKTSTPKTTALSQPTNNREFLKSLLTHKVKNPETGHMIQVGSALKYDKNHPAYRTAAGLVNAWAKKHNINLRNR